MIGLDTNVLIRLLTGDDTAQKKLAANYIDEFCSAETPGYINRIVLVEIVWVLETAYRYTRAQIADVIARMLRTSEFRIEDADAAWSALREYRDGADFADAVIVETNERAGCRVTATFDERATRRLRAAQLIT